jgi:hypothetical protein
VKLTNLLPSPSLPGTRQRCCLAARALPGRGQRTVALTKSLSQGVGSPRSYGEPWFSTEVDGLKEQLAAQRPVVVLDP